MRKQTYKNCFVIETILINLYLVNTVRIIYDFCNRLISQIIEYIYISQIILSEKFQCLIRLLKLEIMITSTSNV